jgi:preprotein translocase subunit SecE
LAREAKSGVLDALGAGRRMKTAMLDNLKDTPEQVGGWFSRAKKFLAEVRAELGRVTWPTSREVWATTVVVIAISFIIGIYLYIVDLGLSAIVAWVFERAGR